MAKVLKQDPITKSDIEEYLAKYSDFTFEVKTLNLLLSHGYKCKHSGTYTDPITQKTREYDIRAEVRKQISDTLTLSLLLAIECKNLKDNFPLVVHCMPRAIHEESEEIIFSYHNEEEELLILSIDKINKAFYYATTIPLHRTLSLYKRGEPVGKSCDQIGRATNNDVTGSDTDVFDKISQALNSSYDLINEAASYKGYTVYSLSIIKPILIVPDNSLWQIIYDENGNIAVGPEQVRYIPYYYGKIWRYTDCEATHNYKVSNLDIVTFSYLQDHISSVLAFENEDLIDHLKVQRQYARLPKGVNI